MRHAPDAPRLRGVIAAAVTPLGPGGDSLDEAAVGPLVDFMAAAGLDGFLAMGTTGEGIMLSPRERRRMLELFVAAAGRRLRVIAHCGAQSTRDTVVLAEHAGSAGADGVAVIAPPYFPFDEPSLLAHFAAAAEACAPLPFYVYEFAARSGYAVPVAVVEALRKRAPNLAGLKVSDSPWAAVRPYLLPGLDVFVGSEGLISEAMAAGAAGSVSGLAAALPELVVEAVRTGSDAASRRCAEVRDAINRFPFQSAAKAILSMRGVPVRDAVRMPLRALTPAERDALAATLEGLVPELL